MSVNPRDLAWLKRAAAREGKSLAKRVRRGELTRRQLEAALELFGDAEPAIALRWLDKWGIKN